MMLHLVALWCLSSSNSLLIPSCDDAPLARQSPPDLIQNAVAEATGCDATQPPDTATWQRMLREASDREARFDSGGANALRQRVIDAYDRVCRPGEAEAQLAIQAGFDGAAAFVGEGQMASARAWIKQVFERFPEADWDAARHPPAATKLFEEVRVSRENIEHATFHFTSNCGDTLSFAPMEGQRHAKDTWHLAPGLRRLTPRCGNIEGWTRLRHARPQSSETIHVAPQQESELALHRGCLACGSQCHASAAALSDVLRLDVQFLPDRAPFEWYDAIPLVGQWRQRRPWAGALFSAAAIGLGVWNITAVANHQDSIDRLGPGGDPDLRSTRNLSAGLFWGTLAASSIEAIIVGLLSD